MFGFNESDIFSSGDVMESCINKSTRKYGCVDWKERIVASPNRRLNAATRRDAQMNELHNALIKLFTPDFCFTYN